MDASSIIFYCIAAFTLGTALLAVTTNKIFRSAIWLLFSLIGIAALYIYLQVEFIAAVQVVVYVGGIVVLIIFSIFLTQQSGTKMPKPTISRTIFSVLAALFGFAFTYLLISEYGFNETQAAPFVLNVKDIGRQMLSTTDYGFVLPFEVVSILLLAAMIGCIVIAIKSPSERKETKVQSSPAKQLITAPEEEIQEEVL